MEGQGMQGGAGLDADGDDAAAEAQEGQAAGLSPEEQERQEREQQEAYDQWEEALLERMNARLRKCADALAPNRAEQAEDVKFRRGGLHQYDTTTLNARNLAGRPVRSFNVMGRFVNEIVNSGRMGRPAGKVGMGKGGDKRIAALRQDIIRNIELMSEADVAYDMALDHNAERGEGFIGVEPAMQRDGTLMPMVELIDNPAWELYDPECKQPTCSDAKYWFSLIPMDVDDYNATWPEGDSKSAEEHHDSSLWRKTWARIRSTFKKTGGGGATGDSLDVAGMMGGKGTRIWIAKYFEKDGEAEGLPDRAEPAMGGQPMTAAQETGHGESAAAVERAPAHRAPPGETVGMYWVSRTRVLERSRWLGRYIPRARSVGTMINDQGEKITEGVIRQAKDTQRGINEADTAALEALGLDSFMPPVVKDIAISSYEQNWKNKQKNPQAYLLLHGETKAGEPIDNPMISGPVASQPAAGALALSAKFEQRLYEVTGIAPAQLVQDKSARGERHELARQRKGEVGTFHFLDNHARAIRHIWRIVNDALPNYLEGQEEAEAMSEAMEHRLVRIGHLPHGEAVAVTDTKPGPDGQPEDVLTYDLSVGDYPVWIDAGPQLSTRQQEAQEGIRTLIESVAPPGSPLAIALAPLVALNSDWPMKDTMFEILVAETPPGVQAIYKKEGVANPEQIAATAMAQVQQQQAFIQKLQQAMQQLAAQVKDKQVEQQVKVIQAQLKLKETQVRAQAELLATQMRIRGDRQTMLHGMVLDHASRTAPPLPHMLEAEADDSGVGEGGPPAATQP